MVAFPESEGYQYIYVKAKLFVASISTYRTGFQFEDISNWTIINLTRMTAHANLSGIRELSICL
jgi:hypothetical protein